MATASVQPAKIGVLLRCLQKLPIPVWLGHRYRANLSPCNMFPVFCDCPTKIRGCPEPGGGVIPALLGPIWGVPGPDRGATSRIQNGPMNRYEKLGQ